MRKCLFFMLLLLFSMALPTQGTETDERPEAENGFSPLDLGVKFFQQAISPVDGPRCNMYPTCSAYARQAARERGLFMGIMLTVDRLLHEVEPDFQQRPIEFGGRWRFSDPLADNTRWWDESYPASKAAGVGRPAQ